MAIDARVVGISFTFDVGSQGHLILEDRPANRKKGEADGIAGQKRLFFDSAPAWAEQLVNCDIWGSANCIMYRQQEIATRKGYTSIVFTAKKLHGLGPAQVREATEAAKLERWTKEELEQLLRQIGHAINVANGRCGVIEDALIKAQSLTMDHLNRVDPLE